jgi:hypothetical protein
LGPSQGCIKRAVVEWMHLPPLLPEKEKEEEDGIEEE